MIGPSPNHVYDIHNPLGLRLLTTLRKSRKDLNSEISITKREITKTGPFIKNKEITVYHC